MSAIDKTIKLGTIFKYFVIIDYLILFTDIQIKFPVKIYNL